MVVMLARRHAQLRRSRQQFGVSYGLARWTATSLAKAEVNGTRANDCDAFWSGALVLSDRI
jgi:hypothetical protein